MEILKSLLVILFSFGKGMGSSNEINMVLDTVKFYEKQTAVVAKVCWGLAERKQLAIELMNPEDSKTIQYVEHFFSIIKFKAEDMVIILDLKCQDSRKFLKKADKLNMFETPYRWILLSGEENLDYIPLEIKDLSILVDSDVIVSFKMKEGETILRRVYKIDSMSDYTFDEYAIWTFENGLILKPTSAILARKNLKRKRIGISIVSVSNSSEKDFYELKDFVTDNVGKSSFHNVLPLYDFLNATVEILFTNTWGYYINNTWNGMTGQMMRGEADLCGTVTLMRRDRMDVLSYLSQPISLQAKFVFREPPLSLQNNLFYLPFRSTVWLSIGGLVIILVAVIYVTAKWEISKSGTNCDYDDPTVLKPNVSDVVLLVAGAVVQQGGNSYLKGFRGRVVTFIMFLIFLFLYTSYSANIVALLQSSSDQIHTLSDLLNSKLELGVEDQPYTRYYFTTATDQVRKAIYENKIARSGHKPNFMPIEEGVKKLQNIDAPFAFHMNIGTGYRIVENILFEHEKCGLREIEYIPNGVPWLCCNKRSPYKELYKIGLIRISEHGINIRINRLFYSRKPTCHSRGGNFGSVNMTDFHPVLLCLLYGMVVSVMLLFLEILVHNRQMRLKSKMEQGVFVRDIDAVSNEEVNFKE